MLLPWNFIYQMSSWTRAIVIPLAIVQAANTAGLCPPGSTSKSFFCRERARNFSEAKRFTLAKLLLRRRPGVEDLGEVRSEAYPQKAIAEAKHG